MVICITAQGNTRETAVDPRFGRCQYFIFVDSETGAYEAMENPHKDGGGAGIQAGQTMAEKKVSVVLTGNVGPNAFRTLQAAQIAVITGVTGTVADAVEKYKQGTLRQVSDGPSVAPHHGQQG